MPEAIIIIIEYNYIPLDYFPGIIIYESLQYFNRLVLTINQMWCRCASKSGTCDNNTVVKTASNHMLEFPIWSYALPITHCFSNLCKFMHCSDEI